MFGLSQSQQSGWTDAAVLIPLGISLLAAVSFVLFERYTTAPLVNFSLLRERNYLGASISQLLGGMAEIGLGVIFPLLLILNLTMSPALAGLALIPTTVPMVLVAPLAGRWYDRAGGRPPLVTGYALLALSGVLSDHDQGQASGVSATAEQFGGALGIAVLYSVFHARM